MKTYQSFDEYYIDTNGNVRANYKDLHVFRFSELGKGVLQSFGPFKIDYFQFAIGSTLSAEVNVFDKKKIAEKFALIIFCPGQVIEWKKTGEWDGFVLNVKSETVIQAFGNEIDFGSPILTNLKPLVLPINEQQHDLLRNVYEMLLSEQTLLRENNYEIMKSLTRLLVQYINRILRASNELLDDIEYANRVQIASRFKRLVLEHCFTSKEVSFYAELLKTNITQLNRYVNKTYGKTPKEYINEVIFLHAKTLLSQPNASVKEIAFDLNFDDYSHFVKFFRKMEGKSPAEYIKTLV